MKSTLKKILILLLFLLFLYTVSIFLQQQILEDVMSILSAFFSAAILVCAYRETDTNLKLRWLWFILAVISWGIGDFQRIFLDLQGLTSTDNLVIVISHFTTNVLFGIGIVHFTVSFFKKWNTVQLILDTITISSASMLFIWSAFFNHQTAILGKVLAQGFIATATILINSAMLIGTFIWLFSVRSKNIPKFLCINAIGISIFAAVDLYSYYLNFYGIYFPNSFLDICFSASFLLIALGALYYISTHEQTILNEITIINTGETTPYHGYILLIFPLADLAIGQLHLSGYLFYLSIFAFYQSIEFLIQQGIRREYLLKKELHLNEALNEQLTQLHDLTQRDSLTNLHNRNGFLDLTEQKLKEMNYPETAALFCIDADRFNIINDIYGYRTGDYVMQVLARRIAEMDSNEAIPARLGEDEFALLVIGEKTEEEFEQIAQQLIERCSQPIHADPYIIEMTFCVGIAFFPQHTQNSSSLLKYADMALDHAKSEGCNIYSFFDPLFDETLHHKNELELLLRQADIEKDFELHYQPQYNAQTKQLIGMEALIRWNHASKGYIPPNEFIPVAEEIDLISPLGFWVVTEAVHQIAKWNRKFQQNLKMGINISPKQLLKDDFFPNLQKLIEQEKIEPSCLDIEITENIMISNEKKAYEIFKHCKQIGVTISIDDFGTGYSSFTYLRKYPFDRIKIDKSLIDTLTTDPNGREIVRAIINLAVSIEIETIAEGVETQEQLEILKELGCQQIQGYLSGRPVAPDQFEKLYSKKLSEPY